MDDIDTPLQKVPFNKFHCNLGNTAIKNRLAYLTSVFGYLRRMHIYPRAFDRRWNREFKKVEQDTEENYMIDEEVLEEENTL